MNFSLCHTCNAFFQRRRAREEAEESKHLMRIYEGIQKDLIDERTNFTVTFNTIVNEAIMMTKSQYGVLATIDESGQHTVLAITNAAWNYSTFNFYREYRDVTNFHRFLENFDETVICNTVPKRTSIPDGHPPLERWMISPIRISKRLRLYLMLSNKKSKYTRRDKRINQHLVRAVGAVVSYYLFIVND